MKKILYLFIAILVFSCSEAEEPCKPNPTLTTNEAKEINDTSATLSGEVIAPTCDETVTSQGFVYAETTLPKITDNVVEVNGVVISKQITGLKQNKIYYYRTYFTNPIGTFYGNEITFKTMVGGATLNKTSIRNITAISAFADSNITGNGEGEISKRGVCWSTNQNPTTADSKTEDGTGIGQFSSELTNLKANTTYYLRTYAINEAGTTYGEEINFKTRDGVITLTTKQISNITIDSAVSGGNITDDGGAPVTMRGVCWSTNQNPTTADSKTEDGTGIGQFNSELTNLKVNTTYYIRAYAINKTGISYGNEYSFIPISSFKLSDNGVTCICTSAKVGEKGIINGVVYEAVDNELLIKRRDEGVDMSKLCTSLVTNMKELFYKRDFNQPIGSWDVSNVTTMERMFSDSSFNQPIGYWNTYNVQSMRQMFSGAQSFNQDISSWPLKQAHPTLNIPHLSDVAYMFFNARSFNQDLSSWYFSWNPSCTDFAKFAISWTKGKPRFRYGCGG